MSARYFAKRPGGPSYEFAGPVLAAAFNRGEMDGWLVRGADWPEWNEWVPIEDEFGELPPRAKRVNEVPSFADTADELEHLNDLNSRGVIDDDEYVILKQAVIARFTDPPVSQPRALEPHRGQLVLTLGILGCVPVLCFFAVLAMAMGRHDLNRMRDGFMDRSGETQTRMGFNLGAVVSLLLALAFGFLGCVAIIGR